MMDYNRWYVWTDAWERTALYSLARREAMLIRHFAYERAFGCQHPDTDFDRSICACGSMHSFCTVCHRAIDCPLDREHYR